MRGATIQTLLSFSDASGLQSNNKHNLSRDIASRSEIMLLKSINNQWFTYLVMLYGPRHQKTSLLSYSDKLEN